MRKKLVGFLMLVMCLVFSLGALVACSTPDAPETKEGEIYRTSVATVNANVKAYVSFKDISEANEWGESGKVYEIIVSSYGGNYSMWADGHWELDGDTLKITPKNQDDKTCFTDTEKEVEKTYTATDGIFSLTAKVGGGNCTFTLNPTTDKVGESTKEPCVTHVDENGDGECDKCGEDMPQVEPPEEAQVQVEMTAKTSVEIPSVMTINAEAKLDLYDNNTWMMFIKTDANPAVTDYVKAASGTWSLDSATYVTTLTVVEQTEAESLPATLTVNCDASGYPNLVYTSTVAYVSNNLTFNFSFTNKAPIVTLTAQKSIEPYLGHTVTADAKIELFEDNTWVMSIKTNADPSKPDYEKAASGTYTNTQTEMTLTVIELTVEGSEMANTITVAVDASGYPTIAYSASVTYTNMMSFDFEFNGLMNS